MGRFLIGTALAIMAASAPAPVFAANPAAGAQVFTSQCSVCHGNRINSPPGVGPRLFGVVGRKAGSLPNYNYSPAMKSSGKTWTTDQLKVYIANPAKTIPGIKMPYPGLHKPDQLEDLVTYLQTLR